MGKIAVLKVDGKFEVSDMNTFDLQEVYKKIDCDTIDVADTPFNRFLSFKACLVFDEEFLIKNKPKINKKASVLYGYHVTHNEVLCGNVAFAKEAYFEEYGEYDLAPLTESEVEEVKKLCDRLDNITEIMSFKLHNPTCTVVSF